ncbi:ferredoxin reductase family protein [Candidatus Woesearchaeota archaeon]|nr:ferredoxin reductase family protein [Candidatus Woesearchaeota archaeon]
MRSWAGWTLLLVIGLLPVILWVMFGPGSSEFSDYESITHSLGELAGLVGMTMFALAFLLSTRATFIEDLFGGLDKVYVAHGIVGGAALTTILFHPILLVVKFLPDDAWTAAQYLLPSKAWSVNFGIIALLGLVFLVSLTLFVKMKYQHWKFTHTFMGLVFAFAVLHIFLVPIDATKDYIFHGYYAYAIVVTLIGFAGFTYTLFLKTRWFKSAFYRVESVTKTGADAFEIALRPEHKPLAYRAGQFVFLRFYNSRLSKEAHPFSIASKSNDPVLRIAVKALGDYTSRLQDLRPGDKVSVEGPHGRFSQHTGDRDAVWVAGGIGIAPFLGMAEDLPDSRHRTDLYFSARRPSELYFLDRLKALAARVDAFRVFPWLSNTQGYLTIDGIERTSGPLIDKEFYLCGPAGLKRSIIAGLLARGVPRSRIHQEEFTFK